MGEASPKDNRIREEYRYNLMTFMVHHKEVDSASKKVGTSLVGRVPTFPVYDKREKNCKIKMSIRHFYKYKSLYSVSSVLFFSFILSLGAVSKQYHPFLNIVSNVSL